MTFTQVTKCSIADINRFDDNVRRIAMCTALKQVTVSYAVLQDIWPAVGLGGAGRGVGGGVRKIIT